MAGGKETALAALRAMRMRGMAEPAHESRLGGQDVFGEHPNPTSHRGSVTVVIQDGARNSGPLGDDEEPPEDAEELEEEY